MGYTHDVFHAIQKRAAQCGDVTSQDKDKNIGSATESNSLSGFLSTLVVNFIVFAVMLLLFLILRKSQRRQYAPRTYVGTVKKEKRTDPLPDGIFAWVGPLIKINESYIIEKTSLDSYFFLRYLKISILMMFVGCLITWPVLFPLNITGGGGQTQLDMLAMGNIDKNTHKNWYWGHVLVAYVFIGFILFTIYREMMHFIAVKQAYLCSSIYANRVSARTLLVTSIPDDYLSVPQLLKLFDNVARIWINTDVKELEKTVAERDKLALKLEAAEVKYIRVADKNRRAAIKKGGESGAADTETGSVGARWVSAKDRPSHKLKFLVGQKVDTIDWSRTELKSMNEKIKELQARQRTDQVKQLNSAFVEFTTQQAAQIAFQCLASNLPLHMAPRYIGITPDEIVWPSLRLKWWERLVKITIVTAFIAALVIFWSIPVAVVGSISNINYLTCQLPWLSFINSIPKAILGVITGLLPVVALAILMALLPIILRKCAKIAGKPSLSTVELHVQNSYFAFQVVQVFLITTLSSAIASSVQQIIKDPVSVTSLLAKSIPKASNFYISYMILQGLAVSAGALLQIVGLIVGKLLSRILDGTPRKKWNRWTKLSGLGWGTVFPVYTNIVVISITYAPIAPLILGFSCLGISLFYLAYKHNLLFVYDNSIDTKGMVYPRALYQTLTGVYLAEICMIGLFAIGTAPGPLILSIILLVGTVLYQIALTNAFGPMLEPLPRNLQIADNNPVTTGDSNGGEKSAATSEAVEGAPKVSKFKKFFQPHIYSNYLSARALIPQHETEYTYSPEDRENAYAHPALSATEPALWLAKDEAGVSAEEIEGCKAFDIVASDEFAWVDEKSKVQWEPEVGDEQVNPPDYHEKLPM